MIVQHLAGDVLLVRDTETTAPPRATDLFKAFTPVAAATAAAVTEKSLLELLAADKAKRVSANRLVKLFTGPGGLGLSRGFFTKARTKARTKAYRRAFAELRRRLLKEDDPTKREALRSAGAEAARRWGWPW